MVRTLVISDIHGCLDEFKKLLKLVNYLPNEDRLLLLGDYVDRGPKSKEVVQLVMKLTEYRNVIVLRGNHDDRFISLLNMNLDVLETFIKYGGKETLNSYCAEADTKSINEVIRYINQHYQEHIEFLSNTKYYYEDNEFVYVHAGLDPNYKNWRDQPLNNFLTIREDFINTKTSVDKKIIFGHTQTSKLQDSSNIWFSDDKIGIDGGCAFGNQLNCLEIIDKNILNQYFIKKQ